MEERKMTSIAAIAVLLCCVGGYVIQKRKNDEK